MADSTCDNCDEELADCDCGNCETYNNTDGPICPYCGAVVEACESEGELYSEDCVEWSCGSCDRDFRVSVYVSYSWTCHRKDEE